MEIQHLNTSDEIASDRARWLAAPDICDLCGEAKAKGEMSAWSPRPGTQAWFDKTWDEDTLDSNRARDQYVGTCVTCAGTEPRTLYRMAIDWGDGLEAHFAWLTTEKEARRYYERERQGELGIYPTALIGQGGSILASDE